MSKENNVKKLMASMTDGSVAPAPKSLFAGSISSKPKKLKLFVWEDVLTDYTSGVMFALAYDVAGARKTILKKMGYKEHPELNIKPKIVSKTAGFFCYGGG